MVFFIDLKKLFYNKILIDLKGDFMRKIFNINLNVGDNDILGDVEVMSVVKNVLSCKSCSGEYTLRDGKYGPFFGCSNFPKCKSTAKILDVIYDYFSIMGVNIYRWEKECWKCKKVTYVYSYYLNYELRAVNDFLEGTCTMGLGDLKSLDKVLMDTIPTIKSKFSKTLNSNDIANTCSHCGSLQGNYFVVTDPHEILNELMISYTMDQYLYKNIDIKDIDGFKNDLSEFLRVIYSNEE